jgi:galactokinase
VGDSEKVAAVARAFSEWTGRPPASVWAAPGRVNLIGEHTDYNGGFVLPLAIDRRTHVAVAARDDGIMRCRSDHEPGDRVVELDRLEPRSRDENWGWAVYAAGVAWALIGAGIRVPGADLLLDTDLPVAAGLSSSAALEVGVTAALASLSNVTLPAERLAGLAHRGESEFVGVPSGIMDQAIVAAGKAGHVLFLDTRSGSSELVPFDLGAAGLTLVVIDTGERRRLDDGRYAERRHQCEEAARILGVPTLRDASLAQIDAAATLTDTLRRRARHVVTENERVLEVVDLLRAGDIRSVGPALVASHRSLRDDFEVSTEALDLAVEASLDSGAIGARLTGAGFGGCALALSPSERVDELRAHTIRTFADRRLGPPKVYPVVASDGVTRIA